MGLTNKLDFPARTGEYKAPPFPTVSVRVLRPFVYRAERWHNGRVVPLDEPRRVEVGEVLEGIIRPEAESWAAAGKVEII